MSNRNATRARVARLDPGHISSSSTQPGADAINSTSLMPPPLRPGLAASAPNTQGQCDCHMYMPFGEHDPFEHGVTPPDLYEPHSEAEREAGQRAEEIIREQVRAEQAAREELCRRNLERSQLADRKKLMMETGGETMWEFAKAVGLESKSATFTCGGSIPILQDPSAAATDDLTPSTRSALQDRPFSIRWGSNGHGRLLNLPTTGEEDDKSLEQLIRDCVPATFGRSGKDVYDESYRRAGAMGKAAFMTDFCPYEAGIVDVITQLLAPSVISFANDAPHLQRGLRAELYKLNVYSGPSGMFKAHVDTPRRETQIGSLVVCLPTPFQGGALAVRHQGQEVIHDWASANSSTAIQWAAFYSDCEHEVLEVTAGHRITLTYNLFLSAGNGTLSGRHMNKQLTHLPLSKLLQTLLADRSFLPEGRFIGLHLIHNYPHSHPNLHRLVPRMLKGADMAVYEAVLAASLTCAFVPINGRGFTSHSILTDLEEQDRRHSPSILNHLQAFETSDVCVNEWDDSQSEPDSDEDFPTDSDDCEDECDEARRELFRKHVDAKKATRRIIWLNSIGNKEVSKAYVAYGNQAELKVKYTSAALVFKVPSWSNRAKHNVADQEKEVIMSDG